MRCYTSGCRDTPQVNRDYAFYLRARCTKDLDFGERLACRAVRSTLKRGRLDEKFMLREDTHSFGLSHPREDDTTVFTSSPPFLHNIFTFTVLPLHNNNNNNMDAHKPLSSTRSLATWTRRTATARREVAPVTVPARPRQRLPLLRQSFARPKQDSNPLSTPATKT